MVDVQLLSVRINYVQVRHFLLSHFLFLLLMTISPFLVSDLQPLLPPLGIFGWISLGTETYSLAYSGGPSAMPPPLSRQLFMQA